MDITTERFRLMKRHALTISRGTITGSENVLVRITHPDANGRPIEGWGEMAPSDVTDDTADSAVAAAASYAEVLAALAPWDLQRVEGTLGPVPKQGSAIRAALDLACHDWIGKRAGLPLWRLWGLDVGAVPSTSLTVGINPPDVVREVTAEILTRTGARALKVKLGSPEGIEHDRAIFVAAQETAAAFTTDSVGPIAWRVDANGGWTLETARTMIAWLAARRVEFVEQPLAQGDEASLPGLRPSPVPIFVDESVRLAADIPALAACVDGINLKLMKCGGLREGLRMVHTARAHGLSVMIGCMGE